MNIIQDEWQAFLSESKTLKFFRIWDAYGLLSSIVSCFTTKKSNPVTLSMYIITVVGTLCTLTLARNLRLASSSTQRKRTASLKLASFSIAFHVVGFFLSTFAFVETKSLDILFVWLFHIVMVVVEIAIVLFRAFQLLFCKHDEMTDKMLTSESGDISMVTMDAKVDGETGVTTTDDVLSTNVVDDKSNDVEVGDTTSSIVVNDDVQIIIREVDGRLNEVADLESEVDDFTDQQAVGDITFNGSKLSDIEVNDAVQTQIKF
mmetsp:Transcript_31537/g.45409  ORF Transcript_31537/g.45409 Transcript_31537/m.45409 type:complete len:261 (+) Transcript_31537:236-1018(+)